MNLQEILIAAIPGLLALVGFIYNEYRKRKNAEDANNQSLQARREPTWNELVTENRNQRVEVALQGEQIASLREDFTNFERKMDRKITAFENILRDVANQWPAHMEPPVFDSEDLSELLDANIPWKGRVRIVPGLA